MKWLGRLFGILFLVSGWELSIGGIVLGNEFLFILLV